MMNPTVPFSLAQLYALIQERKITMQAGSYTVTLFQLGEDWIIQKVGEEAVELILAAKSSDRTRVIAEAADLTYHALVMLVQLGITIEDVEKELARRHAGASDIG